MCGRYSFFEAENLYERFEVSRRKGKLEDTYNAAPAMKMPVIVAGAEKSLAVLRWGIKPPWEKEDKKRGIINARAETVAEKRTFKKMFESSRCVVPARGWFEWQNRGGNKQPYYFKRKDDDWLALAGLHNGEEYLILTSDAWPKLEDVHPRMPLVLTREAEETWLNPDVTEEAQLIEAMEPMAAGNLLFYPVAASVNNPNYQEKQVINPEVNQVAK